MSRVVHFEIHADDCARAAKFYEALFGWQFSKWEGPMEYWLIVTGPDGTPGINGGMIPRQHPRSAVDAIVAYVCTIQVDHLDDSVQKALSLGGAIALPKMPIPGVGWLAYLKDTEQNIFGMMQNDPSVAG